MDNMNTAAATAEAKISQDYLDNYAPGVHKIGRSTMAIALVLSYLPILYMYFVKGWSLPLSSYITVLTTIAALRVGMWISEPFTWFPVIGAASLYMGYFSGNVKNIRVPVARAVQENYNVTVDSPRGQIVTTLGVGVSVFVNLIILLIIVLFGNWFIPKLPASIVGAFNYVIPALIGSLLSGYVKRYGVVKTLLWSIPGLLVFICIKTGLTPGLNRYGQSVAIGITVLIGYIIYLVQGAKENKADAGK